LRYKLSLRDLAEMFLTRGFSFTHETCGECVIDIDVRSDRLNSTTRQSVLTLVQAGNAPET